VRERQQRRPRVAGGERCKQRRLHANRFGRAGHAPPNLRGIGPLSDCSNDILSRRAEQVNVHAGCTARRDSAHRMPPTVGSCGPFLDVPRRSRVRQRHPGDAGGGGGAGDSADHEGVGILRIDGHRDRRAQLQGAERRMGHHLTMGHLVGAPVGNLHLEIHLYQGHLVDHHADSARGSDSGLAGDS